MKDHVNEVSVYRPRVFNVTEPENKILDSSNAKLEWRTQIVSKVPGRSTSPPPHNPWTKFIVKTHFFMHQTNSAIVIRRFALGSNASILYRDGSKDFKEFEFEINKNSSCTRF